MGSDCRIQKQVNSYYVCFRLNEGHTVFVERKIASRLHGGEQMRHFKAYEGWNELQNAVSISLF